MKSLRFLVVLLLCLGVAPRPGETATATSSFQVSITIATACVINSATNMTFAQPTLIILPIDATSTITVTCSLLAPYNIGLDGGGSGNVAARVMTGIANGGTISYQLYQDVTRLVVWGNTVGTDTVAFVGTGLAIGHTVYGRVPVQTSPVADTYRDTIGVTVTF